jgi:ubiquinol-cytochrome c reductase iron-sulfur subunit
MTSLSKKKVLEVLFRGGREKKGKKNTKKQRGEEKGLRRGRERGENWEEKTKPPSTDEREECSLPAPPPGLRPVPRAQALALRPGALPRRRDAPVCGRSTPPPRSRVSFVFCLAIVCLWVECLSRCVSCVPPVFAHALVFVVEPVADDKLANHRVVEFKEGDFPAEKWDGYRTKFDFPTQRNFSYFVLGAGAAATASGAKSTVISLLSTMSASADVLALSNIEVDLSTIQEGDTITVTWRGKPLFIRHRTAAEIKQAEDQPIEDLPDKEADVDRRQRPQWMVVLGICTHLGCVPLNNAGDYGGWFCPCHGSHYDVSGRIRKGPAPLNLEVPPYGFIDDNTLFIGE